MKRKETKKQWLVVGEKDKIIALTTYNDFLYGVSQTGWLYRYLDQSHKWIKIAESPDLVLNEK